MKTIKKIARFAKYQYFIVSSTFLEMVNKYCNVAEILNINENSNKVK
jgi:hypothetical protein